MQSHWALHRERVFSPHQHSIKTHPTVPLIAQQVRNKANDWLTESTQSMMALTLDGWHTNSANKCFQDRQTFCVEFYIVTQCNGNISTLLISVDAESVLFCVFTSSCCALLFWFSDWRIAYCLSHEQIYCDAHFKVTTWEQLVTFLACIYTYSIFMAHAP